MLSLINFIRQSNTIFIPNKYIMENMFYDVSSTVLLIWNHKYWNSFLYKFC